MSSAAPSFGPCSRCDTSGGSSGSPDVVAAALVELAAALREIAGLAPPDPLRLLRAEPVAELLELPPADGS